MTDYAKTILNMLRGTHAPRTAPVEPSPDVMKAAADSVAAKRPAPVEDMPTKEHRPTRSTASDCDHQWQWKGGVKSCWLCGQPEDIRSRRDKSTSWQAKVYGGKR